MNPLVPSTSDAHQTAGGSYLAGLLAAAAVAVVGVELLSLVSLIEQSTAIVLGGVCCAALIAACRFWVTPPHGLRGLGGVDRGIILVVVAIMAITLVIALMSPPNTWDSMTYHSARVAEWYAHGNVRFYPTSIDRQLWQPPFAEYLVLLTYAALGGRDYFANLPQWLAGIGVIVASMEIAASLGASKRYQVAAALLVATTPTVILQSTSTQADLLTALWVAITALLAIRQYSWAEFPGSRRAILFGTAFGLSVGTKGTGLLLGMPWLFVFLVPAARRRDWAALGRQLVCIAGVVLALNVCHFARNYSLYRNPLGPASVQRALRPASLGPEAILSNLVANASLHVGTPSETLNEFLRSRISSGHSALGLDLHALYPYFGGFRIVPWSTHEDLAGNPLQFLLGGLGLAIAAIRWRRLASIHKVVTVALLAGVILFAATVRWQPFNSRLHLPTFVLLAPCIALFLRWAGPKWNALVLATAVVVALPPLLMNKSRPLVVLSMLGQGDTFQRSIVSQDREEQYFANRPELLQSYTEMVAQLRASGCARADLYAGYDSWEYPLWVLAKGSIEYRHAAVGNLSGQLESVHLPACALVGLNKPPTWRPPAGELLWQAGEFSLWKAVGQSNALDAR